MYFPEYATFKGTDWGSLWWIVRTRPNTVTGTAGQAVTIPARAYLVESVGPAVIVQGQLTLQEGTLATDRTYDGTLLGSNRTRADGIIGPQTLRQLWTYVKLLQDRGLLPRNQAGLDRIKQAAENRMPDGTAMAALMKATYHAPRLIRRVGQQDQTNSAPLLPIPDVQAVSLWSPPANMPGWLQPIPYPVTTDVIRVLPTFARLDRSMPAPPAELAIPADSIGTEGTLVPGARGPWTLRPGQIAPLNTRGEAPPASAQQPQFPVPQGTPIETEITPIPGKDGYQPPVATEDRVPATTQPNAAANVGGLASSLASIVSARAFPVLAGVTLVAGLGMTIAGAMGVGEDDEEAEKRRKTHAGKE